uniref:BACK domain-containing protein n=1 Tax=Mesocestoides corti TaxID=53468 RepID=A0A5K3FYF2_MESCO
MHIPNALKTQPISSFCLDCHGNVHEFFPASESEPLTLETFTWKPIFTIQNVSIARLLVLRKRC